VNCLLRRPTRLSASDWTTVTVSCQSKARRQRSEGTCGLLRPAAVMSLTDTQFTYISGNDSSSLPRTVSVRERAVARRSSSVKSPLQRQRHVTSSRDVDATLCWSKSWFSVQQLAREFDRRFPVLSRVMQGYRCSDVNALKLNVGQVSNIT